LVVLPELFSTGYCFASKEELLDLAEDLKTGPTVTRLQALSNRTNTMIAAGIAERAQDRVYNSAVLIIPQALRLTLDAPVLIYRKLHLFGREKQLFSPGDRQPGTAIVKGVCIGLEVCFDHFFPELARTLVLQGAQLICHPANLVLPYARQTTIARALENGIFWILCNRIGTEKLGDQELTFNGFSQIIGPRGDILCQAGATEEILRIVDVSPGDADDKRVFPGNDLLKDRRPEMYRL
jgi:predicted amidohydrolase